MTANPIPEAVVEAVARAICMACEENPDRQGDARGNEFRWQDYRDTALAAISALAAAQAQPKRRRYDPSGSLSEYGVFPECDAQQPAEGEDIMVDTPYDVFILPLRPSGLSSGPRFVVHVPGPEQPAAVKESCSDAAVSNRGD